MRPRMVDVAERAGVSIATVSRVLNKTKHVEPQVAEAVWRAIEELEFTPNQHARWLSSGKSNVVGVVMPSTEESGLSPFLHALSGALRANSFDAMIALSDGNRNDERILVQTLLQSHVSALIVVTPYVGGKLRTLLRNTDVPVILAFNEDPGSRIPSVIFNDMEAAEVLASAVPEQSGPVVILSHGKNEIAVRNRVAGFQNVAMERYGTASDLYTCDGSIDDAYRAACELIETARPSLLHTTSDYIAIAAIRAAFDMGCSVPDDVAITGFGVNHYTNTATPSLTTVALDGRDVGRLCGLGAIALLDEKSIPAVQHVGFSLVDGKSCPMKGDR